MFTFNKMRAYLIFSVVSNTLWTDFYVKDQFATICQPKYEYIYPWLFGKWLLEIDGGHREFSSPNHIGLETSQWASENHSSLGKNMLAEAQRDNFCFEGKCSVFQVCIALFLPLGEILASLLGYLQTSLHLLRTLRATTGIY